MPLFKLLTLTALGFVFISASANTTLADPIYSVSSMDKVATIIKMYEQDIGHQGMDNPVVLQQYSSPSLQAAMLLEQDYFDREQMSCHIGYDVLWSSQDPDYAQDVEYSLTEKDWVQVSLADDAKVYYELTCDSSDNGVDCQVDDVILDDDGLSLKKHLMNTCR